MNRWSERHRSLATASIPWETGLFERRGRRKGDIVLLWVEVVAEHLDSYRSMNLYLFTADFDATSSNYIVNSETSICHHGIIISVIISCSTMMAVNS